MSAAIAKGLEGLKPAGQDLIDQHHQQRMHDIKLENIELARQASHAAVNKPAVLRAAMEADTPEERADAMKALGLQQVEGGLFNRRAFMDTANVAIGDQSGRDAFNSPEYKKLMSETTDPRAATAEFLREQQKGMQGLQAASMSARFEELAEPAIQARRTQLVREGVQDQVALQNHVWDMSEDRSWTGWQARLGALRATSSQLGPQAAADAETYAEKRLLDQAAEGKQWALNIANRKHMNDHDGLSMIQRRQDYWDTTAQSNAQAKLTGVETAAQTEAHQNIKLALALGDLPAAAAGLSEVARVHDTKSNEFIKLLGAYQTALNKGQMKAAIFAQTGPHGDLNAYSQAEKKKVDLEFLQRAEEIAEENGWSGDINAGVWNYIADHEIEGSAKSYIAGELDSDDKQRRDRMIGFISAGGAQAKQKVPKSHQRLVELYGRPGMDADEAQEIFRETNAKPRGFEVSTALAERLDLRKQKDIDSTVNRELNTTIEEWGKTQGLGNLGFGDLEHSDMSGDVRPRYLQILKETAHDHARLSDEAIYQIARERLMEELVMGDRDGDLIIGIGTFAMFGSGPSGVQTSRAIDTADVNSYREWVASDNFMKQSGQTDKPVLTQAPGGPGFGTLSGQTPSISTSGSRWEFTYAGTMFADEHYSDNKGMQTWFTLPDGTRGPLLFQGGRVEWLNPEQAKSAFFSGWQTPPPGPNVTRPDNVPENFVPRMVPTEDQMAGDRMMWANIDGAMQLRYVGIDPTDAAVQNMDEQTGKQAVHSGQMGQDRTKSLAKRQNMDGIAGNNMLVSLPDSELDTKARADIASMMPQTGSDTWSIFSKAQAATQERAEHVLNFGGSERGERFYNEYDRFIGAQEGKESALRVYDDDNGNPLFEGDPVSGKRTIAKGYNIDRGDWKQVARVELGMTDKQAQDIWAGRTTLTSDQARVLNRSLAQNAAKKVFGIYKKKGFTGLPDNFYIARISLYHHTTDDMPSMDAAYMRGDWDEVANQIINHTKKGIKPHHLPGVIARRKREAAMMLANHLSELGPEWQYLRGIDPFNN
jgi:hypothetical protein